MHEVASNKSQFLLSEISWLSKDLFILFSVVFELPWWVYGTFSLLSVCFEGQV